jgi:lysophospholipase L1-like esterase
MSVPTPEPVASRTPHRRLRGAKVTLAAVVAVLVGAVLVTPGSADAAAPAASAAPAAAAKAGPQTDQVVTWGASADKVANVSFTDQTVRNLVHTSIAGSGVRISLSNVFGDRAITFDAVHVGVQAPATANAALVPGSNRPVRFGGRPGVTIPAGAEVLSDPVDTTVPADTTIAVSAHLSGASGAVTGHNASSQTSYVSPTTANVAADETGAPFTTAVNRWWFVDAVVVDAPKQVDTVAFLGDSITDGVRSTANTNHRYPDLVADRLAGRPAVRQLGIMNEGISGNRVLVDTATSGVSAQARFDRDVLSQPDVHTVVFLEGINDIRNGSATSPDQLISAYRALIARAHSRNVCIVGGTLTAFKPSTAYTPEKEAIRVAVNEFVRTSGEFDGIVDFDAATRDPADPQSFLPAYDSGDHLHPNDTGYQAMANAVDLNLLECRR